MANNELRLDFVFRSSNGWTIIMGEYFKLLLCISFWETRKYTGIMALLCPFHNLACSMNAARYRKKLGQLLQRNHSNRLKTRYAKENLYER